MDDAHALATIRYIERPVRARLTRAPWTYRWSTAAAHTSGLDPAHLLDLQLWSDLVSGANWKETLTAAADKEAIAALAPRYARRPVKTNRL